MTDPLAAYLLDRIDQPLSWSKVFGGALSAVGAVAAYPEYGLRGAALAAVAVGGFGAVFGFLIGGAVGIGARLIGGLDRPVRRPDYWAIAFGCTRCGWRVTAEGPWRVRDCLRWPECCPSCAAPLILLVPDCPRCGTCPMTGATPLRRLWSLVRWPRDRRQALWGDFLCRQCQCRFDRWGREVPAS